MSDIAKLVAFNPQPDIDAVRLADGKLCLVIDNALQDPQRLIDWAAARVDDFRLVDSDAYPGHYLMTPASVQEALQTFFLRRLRNAFDARRLLGTHCRLSMVTLPPQALQPTQQICHRDGFRLQTEQSHQGTLLYLFKDAELGGTRFYVPARPEAEMARLFADSTTLSRRDFAERYGFAAGYMTGSNDWFTCTGTIPARFNRLIAYDANLLHADDIAAPQKLRTDPRRGRLTLNGFFTCSRHRS